MNVFDFAVVILAIGVIVVACLNGIWSLILGKRRQARVEAPAAQEGSETRRTFARIWVGTRARDGVTDLREEPPESRTV